MDLLCARLSCGHRADASIQFDTAGSRVMIVDLGDSTTGIPLCGHHTRTRTAPLGWAMVDERTGPIQPSLWNPEAPPPAQAGPTDRPSVRRPPEPTFAWEAVTAEVDAPAESAEVSDAAPTTPLLLRAFRNAN